MIGNSHWTKTGVSFEDLVETGKAERTSGRKQNDIVSQLSVACTHQKTGKPYWRCLGPGCKHFRTGNHQLPRIISHAMECKYLSPDLKSLASEKSIQNALGTKVALKELQTTPPDEDGGPTCKKAKLLQSSLKDVLLPRGTIKFNDEINHRIVMLFCISGLPPRVLDTPQWEQLMETASRFKYNPTSSTMVSRTFIPAEAALVRSHQVAFLRTLANLTITFDGGSTRKPSSVYTIHISTADRECFFVEAHDATDEKHTAVYIENLITSVRADLGLITVKLTGILPRW